MRVFVPVEWCGSGECRWLLLLLFCGGGEEEGCLPSVVPLVAGGKSGVGLTETSSVAHGFVVILRRGGGGGGV